MLQRCTGCQSGVGSCIIMHGVKGIALMLLHAAGCTRTGHRMGPGLPAVLIATAAQGAGPLLPCTHAVPQVPSKVHCCWQVKLGSGATSLHHSGMAWPYAWPLLPGHCAALVVLAPCSEGPVR